MSLKGERVRLTERGYEQLRRATRTHREELVLRLCGEAGLRAGEIARIRPEDVTGQREDSSMQSFVTLHEVNGGTRTGYLPGDVAHEFWQYVRSNQVSDGERVIGVTERRVQMLIRDICRRAATETGRAIFDEITPSDLRQFFGQQLLVEHGIDARVVAAVGGWEGLDSILDPLDAPSKTDIRDAFERLEARETGETRRLPRVIECVDSALEMVTVSDSRDQIEHHLCEEVIGEYDAAWLLSPDHQRDRLLTRAHAGADPDRFEGAGSSEIAKRALQTGQVFVGPDEPGPATEQSGSGLLAAVPVEHGETQYGALVVRSESRNSFDDAERLALQILGRETASAITATERKQVLHGDTVLEVQFQYEESDAALPGLAGTLSCTLELDGAVASDEGILCFVCVTGVTAQEALEAATARKGIESSRLIRSDEDSGLIEVGLTGSSPIPFLIHRGGTVTELTVEQNRALLTCELAPETDLRALYDELQSDFPSLELRSKQEREPTEGGTRTRESPEDSLTEKQRAVLRTAYYADYFEWPRGSTAEDLAESMDVSSPTLHNHLRKAQQNLLDVIFEQ